MLLGSFVELRLMVGQSEVYDFDVLDGLVLKLI